MRKLCLQWIVSLGLVLVTSSAMAYTLSTGFDGVVIAQSDLTSTSGLNQWNDLVRWQVQPVGGNPGYWAQQTPNPTGGPETSLLFYGFDASGLGIGTPYHLQFDFINSGSSFGGKVYLGGLDAGEKISRFAPWPDLSTTTFFNAPLSSNTNAWTTASYDGAVAGNFDALYLAFEMGGSAGLRGVDNVALHVGAAPVPEPSSLLLLGLGIGGLALWRRRKVQN